MLTPALVAMRSKRPLDCQLADTAAAMPLAGGARRAHLRAVHDRDAENAVKTEKFGKIRKSDRLVLADWTTIRPLVHKLSCSLRGTFVVRRSRLALTLVTFVCVALASTQRVRAEDPVLQIGRASW